MTGEDKFDVVVYGATGFTGKLVAEYMQQRYGQDREVRWALAGRDRDKLSALARDLGAPERACIVADAGDAGSLRALCEQAHVVLTTVGPYQLYGERLLESCVATGTDYVDLCGEPLFMRAAIDRHSAAASASGARIVFSCGFDSIPFDLGVLFLEQEAKKRLGAPVPRVKGRVRTMRGTFSGGTAASLQATLAALKENPALLSTLVDPFALTPGFTGPEQPKGNTPEEDSSLGSWVAPFIMATINTKNVHRSNHLLGYPFGRDLVYDEMVVTGPGDAGKAAAEALAKHNPLAGKGAPKPGEGPSRQERESGSYDILFIGEGPAGSLRVAVKGDMDPGYGSTSKMIAESALCLRHETQGLAGGIYTPGAAMGQALIKRLVERAGLTFGVET